jgi:hypothetical protein
VIHKENKQKMNHFNVNTSEICGRMKYFAGTRQLSPSALFRKSAKKQKDIQFSTITPDSFPESFGKPNETLVGLNGMLVGLNETPVGLNGMLVGLNETPVGLNGMLVGLNETPVGSNATPVQPPKTVVKCCKKNN